MHPSLLACVRLPHVSSNFPDVRRRVGRWIARRPGARDLFQCLKGKRLAEISLADLEQAASMTAHLTCNLRILQELVSKTAYSSAMFSHTQSGQLTASAQVPETWHRKRKATTSLVLKTAQEYLFKWSCSPASHQQLDWLPQEEPPCQTSKHSYCSKT
jgi:hypothetical protein